MRRFDIDFTSKIEGDEPLVGVFNKVLNRMSLAKAATSPKSFRDFEVKELRDAPVRYCECLLWERWLHESVARLREWVEKTDEFMGEFEGMWRYYACAKRIESIKDGCGDESDYDKDGNIITEGLSDDQLEGFTIIDALYYEDWKDIVQETTPYDFAGLSAALQLEATISVADMLRTMGKEVYSYRKNEDGEMVKNTREDEELLKVSRSVESSDIMTVVNIVASIIYSICEKLKNANKFEDDLELIVDVHQGAIRCLNMLFDDVM